jgi:hypothetical protein
MLRAVKLKTYKIKIGFKEFISKLLRLEKQYYADAIEMKISIFNR